MQLTVLIKQHLASNSLIPDELESGMIALILGSCLRGPN